MSRFFRRPPSSRKFPRNLEKHYNRNKLDSGRKYLMRRENGTTSVHGNFCVSCFVRACFRASVRLLSVRASVRLLSVRACSSLACLLFVRLLCVLVRASMRLLSMRLLSVRACSSLACLWYIHLHACLPSRTQHPDASFPYAWCCRCVRWFSVQCNAWFTCNLFSGS